jgi:hypothetical protein
MNDRGKTINHTVLKTVSYPDETAKEIVKRFCGHVHWLVRLPFPPSYAPEPTHTFPTGGKSLP